MKADILLIAWRRPEAVRQVLESIRAYAPARLFVACDGPNPQRPGEAEKVEATRALIEAEIDWPCQVERLYSEVNQGCRVGPWRAISWFFAQVEEGIILEDDCVPNPDFFLFCETLLKRYRHDERIWCVSGNNFQDGQWRGEASYYFSNIPLTWGWATWRRCWSHYDPAIKLWPKLRDSQLLMSIFDDPSQINYWSSLWQQTYDNADTVTWWDYQWLFACVINHGLTVVPNVNLVTNIGSGSDATHTFAIPETKTCSLVTNEMIHPELMMPSRIADLYTYNSHHKSEGDAEKKSLYARLSSRLRLRSRIRQLHSPTR